MPLISNPLSGVLKHVLNFHDQRHDVIASNVANANTPGYKAFDVVLDQHMGGQKQIEPLRSDPRHMVMGASEIAAGARVETSKATARLDGNNVSLDDEFMKLSQNRTMYAVAFELMDRWGGMNKTAREVR
jgi:flagellar basal-body rod protein FlgB